MGYLQHDSSCTFAVCCDVGERLDGMIHREYPPTSGGRGTSRERDKSRGSCGWIVSYNLGETSKKYLFYASLKDLISSRSTIAINT